MQLQRLLAALLAGTVLVAACGDDDGATAESNEYSEALAENFASIEDAPYDEDQADCVSREFVAALGGPEAFEEQDITPDDLRDSANIADLELDPAMIDTEALAAAMGTCDVSLKDLFLAQSGDDLSDEQRDCIADALDTLDEDQIAQLLAFTLARGRPDDAGELSPEAISPLVTCLSLG